MTYCAAIRGHYERCWAATVAVCKWSAGPVHELPEGFAVLRIAPLQTRPMWTFATCCMSQETDNERLELFLVSPDDAPSHIELLTAVAHYHRTGSRLGLGHSVNFGRPWLRDSACTHGLISLPYLDGPVLERLEHPSGVIRFLWLIPVTPEEVAYKKRHGLDALERRLEQGNFDYLNPSRQSVV